MTIVRQEMKVKVTAQGQRWMQRCVCYTSTYFDVLSVFSLWRHQLRTSAERRAAWRGRIQQQRRSPARSISFGVTSIDNCFHRGMEAAFMRWSCLSVCFVCLSVCLSFCPRAYLRKYMSNILQFSNACYLWPWLGPAPAGLWYFTHFRFCEWRHFCIIGPFGDMSISLQRVTSLRRRAQVNVPAASYWLRLVIDDRGR